MNHHKIISIQIADIRALLTKNNLSYPENKKILEAYESLARFVIENYKMPDSHTNYICKALGVTKGVNPLMLTRELESNISRISDCFDIEIPLRGIESYFSWGKPEIAIEDYNYFKYLIAKLHAQIGDELEIETDYQQTDLNRPF